MMQIGAETVKHRNPFLVALLVVILPIVYWVYWYVATGNELRRAGVGNTSPWVVIVGWATLSGISTIVGVLVAVTIDMPVLPYLILVFGVIIVTIGVIAIYVSFWHSIGMISDRYNDAVFPAMVLYFAPFLLIIFVILAQIELNGYAKAVEECRHLRAPNVIPSAS